MSKTAKIVRKFCERSGMPYKRTYKEVRHMNQIQRGEQLQIMKEFIKTFVPSEASWQEKKQQPTMATVPDQIE